MKQKIQSIFQEAGLKVIGTVGLEATDFLDIFLNLRTGTHRSFVKEGDRPTYVHSQSNHPPLVLKNIGLGVNKRLSMLNANEDLFKQAVPAYQEALQRSKHSHTLAFEREAPTTTSTPCPTKRLRPGGRGQGMLSGGTCPTGSMSTPTSAPNSWP